MTVAAAEAAVGPRAGHRALPPPGDAEPRRLHGAEMVMLFLIPLLPFVGFVVNAFFGRRLSKSMSGGVACAAIIASFAVSAVSVLRMLGDPSGALQQDVFTWIASGRLDIAVLAPPRPSVGADDPRRHRHRLAHPHLLDRLHARRDGRRVRALLLVPEPVRVVHARARARRELPGHVRRLGGGRALLVSADRLLVPEAVGRRRRQEGVRRQPHRRLRVRARHAADLRDVRHVRLPAAWPRPPTGARSSRARA